MRRKRLTRRADLFGSLFCLTLLVVFLYQRTGWRGPNASNERREAAIKYALDGDTLVTTEGEQIRLLGVDTPEMGHDLRRPEFMAEEARRVTQELAEGKSVAIEIEPKRARDRYGRTLAYVFLPDGSCLNERLLQEGLATVFLPASFSRKEAYLALEAQARRAGKGIWRAEGRLELNYLKEAPPLLIRPTAGRRFALQWGGLAHTGLSETALLAELRFVRGRYPTGAVPAAELRARGWRDDGAR